MNQNKTEIIQKLIKNIEKPDESLGIEPLTKYMLDCWVTLLRSGFYDTLNSLGEKDDSLFYNPFTVLQDLQVFLGYVDWIYTSYEIVDWEKQSNGSYEPICREYSKPSWFLRAKNPAHYWLHPDYILKLREGVTITDCELLKIRKWMSDKYFKTLNMSLVEVAEDIERWFT